MEENNKLTFEQKLDGWKNRFTLFRTLARIIAVIVQIVIAWYIIKNK
jgi:hypothetical protein